MITTQQQPAISAITHIELLSNKNIPLAEWNQLQGFISIALVYSLKSRIVQQTIALCQQHKLKAPDAIIAATALVHNLELITRNLTDFKNIPALSLIDPHTL
ncbi:MAG: type II toxin-antitoxin system VapC family toxin [Williamsia sp.]|nr:type II toxin-antitoxin system VapC family toxin [Williamsia sp.]